MGGVFHLLVRELREIKHLCLWSVASAGTVEPAADRCYGGWDFRGKKDKEEDRDVQRASRAGRWAVLRIRAGLGGMSRARSGLAGRGRGRSAGPGTGLHAFAEERIRALRGYIGTDGRLDNETFR